jgi:hypothetical protein
MISIHDRPHDAPAGYAVRFWEINPGFITPGKLIHSLPTIEAARAHVPAGFIKLDRDPDDDPKIVEVWI